MRVLFICHDGALYGAQQSLLALLTGLSQLTQSKQQTEPIAYPVECIVSCAQPGPLVERLKALPHVRLRQHRRLAWFKHSQRHPLQQLGDVLALLFNSILRTAQVARMLEQEQIDLVHSNSIVSLEGALASWLCRVPHVWHIRELFTENSPKLKPVLGVRITRWLIPRLSRRVICISQAVQRQFTEAKDTTNNTRVIYNALLPTQQSLLSSASRQFTQRFVIGYVGRLSAGKRFEDLLKALSLLPGQPPDLLVAGQFVDAAYQQQIQRQLEQFKLVQCVGFLGFQDNLNPFYPQIDVLVVPSLNEAFGRVIIEAMAMGIPCVAANSGGIPEIIEDGQTGFLFPPTDAMALASLLEQLRGNPMLRQQVSQRAQAMVFERFNIQTHTEAVRACYRESLQECALKKGFLQGCL